VSSKSRNLAMVIQPRMNINGPMVSDQSAFHRLPPFGPMSVGRGNVRVNANVPRCRVNSKGRCSGGVSGTHMRAPLGKHHGRARCSSRNVRHEQSMYSLMRRSQQVARLLCGYVAATYFYAYAYGIQKIALTAIVAQAHNSN